MCYAVSIMRSGTYAQTGGNTRAPILEFNNQGAEAGFEGTNWKLASFTGDPYRQGFDTASTQGAQAGFTLCRSPAVLEVLSLLWIRESEVTNDTIYMNHGFISFRHKA